VRSVGTGWMVAGILISVVALGFSIAAFLSVGALAREVGYRRSPNSSTSNGEPEPFSLPTVGKNVEELLHPVISMPVPAPRQGANVDSAEDIVMVDAFLLDDGPILIVSTRCSSCITLLDSLRGSPSAALGLRVLVGAPDLKEGNDFATRYVEGLPAVYQIDERGERASALGAHLTPALLRVENGVLRDAHGVLTAEHVAAVGTSA
jgi:hypothetical protein